MIRRPLALLVSPLSFLRTLTALSLVALSATGASAGEIVKQVGRVTFRVDTVYAFPGGVVVVRLGSRGRLGSAWALLDGRRVAFYSNGAGPHALVPVPVEAVPGPATLGIEIAGRRGEQRIPIPIEIAPRAYPPRAVALPETKRSLLARPEVDHDGRRLLAWLRTESHSAPGPLVAPVRSAGGSGFGEPRSYGDTTPVESRIDGLLGEYHRGVDYAVPAGSEVRSPAAASVLFAGALVLSGRTVVLDHGQGIVSILFHLSRIEAREGDRVTPGTLLGYSGDSGLAPEPMLQWRVYLHGVAVDPLVLEQILG
jgi:murein DD-endopeptidase MepM/ murein hydrolase activator NlpD